MSVRRLQHASVTRPPGREAHQQAVQFYQDVLGLQEIPKPPTFTQIEVTWFRVGEDEIHVVAIGPDDHPAASSAHFCLAVDDLPGVRTRLEGAGHRCHETVPIPGRPRFMTHDPFGNLIELTTIEAELAAGGQ